MESIRLERFRKTFILYVCGSIFLSMFIGGCSSDSMMAANDSKSMVEYQPYAKTLNETQQSQLMTMVEKMAERNQSSLTVDVPSTQSQASSYERALWQARAEYLQQFLRMQGLSAKQIQFRECMSCSNIRIG